MTLAQKLLLNIPPMALCFMMMALAVILSVAGTLGFHRFVPHRSLRVHNDIAGPIFSTLGVIYAVLLAFMVVVVWQNFDRARRNVEMEVNCLADLYVDSGVFEEAFKQKVRGGIGEYTKSVIDEWGVLSSGKHSPKVREAIEKLVMIYGDYSPRREAERVFFEESVGKVNNLLELRIQRLIDARVGIHGLLWFVLITGGIITIAFTIFFGTEKLGAKILMSTLLAVSIALVLFTILEFSFPFTGSASVSCEPFKQLLLRLRL